jgi:putative ABC transport system permease protein
VSALAGDIRFGARTFARRPGFTLGVVLTFACGVAAATLVFAIVNAIFYSRYDAYREPRRLVTVWSQNGRLGVVGPSSVRDVADWRASARAFERLGTLEPGTFTVAGSGDPEALHGGAVNDDLLALLDARAARGRLFVTADRSAGAPRAVLISYGLWQRRYGGAADIAGRVVTVDSRPATIVGVLAQGFTLAPFAGLEPEVLVPCGDPLTASRSARGAIVVGRLRPGATTEQARAELKAIAARLEKSDPAANAGWSVLALSPVGLDFEGDGQFLLVLAVAVGFVLMIVSANVTNLLLVRAASRTREVATRLAIGAGRLRIARQFLTEALMLGAAGSLAGLFLAYWACRGVMWSVSGTAVGYLKLVIDTRVLAFTALVSLGCAALVGVLPAVRLSRTSLMAGLREGFGAQAGSSAGRIRALLVSVEIALAVVLLASAALVLQGVANLRRVDAGIRPRGVMTERIILPAGRYADASARIAFTDDLVSRLSGHRAIASVAVASHLPAVGGESTIAPFTAEHGAPPSGQAPSAWLISTSAGYFDALGISVRLGRAFTPDDRAGSEPVAVVSEGLVKRWMGSGSPVGSRLLVDGQWRTVVGVAADVRNFHVNVRPAPAIYVPYAQRPVATTVLIVRAASGDGLALAPEVRSALGAMDRDLPVRQARSLPAAIEESLGGFDLTRLLIGALSVAALLLAAMGLYTVVSYSVALRTREFGVRTALGAAPGQLQRQVVFEGFRRSLFGALPGLALAVMVGRLLASKLHAVSATNPVVLGGVAVLTVVTVVLASWAPARRAARVDPAVATRAE